MKPYPDPTLPPFVIVDDIDDDIFLLRHRLREGGITNPILGFSSPAEALAFLQSVENDDQRPAIIFTDIRMPGDCGFAFLAEIRSHSEWHAVRLVVVTSSNDSADLDHALDCGANGYLVKFPPSDLLVDFVHNGPWFSASRQTSALVGS